MISGEGYLVSDLGAAFSGRERRLFVEAVEASDAPGDLEIRMEIDPDGNGGDYDYMPAIIRAMKYVVFIMWKKFVIRYLEMTYLFLIFNRFGGMICMDIFVICLLL